MTLIGLVSGGHIRNKQQKMLQVLKDEKPSASWKPQQLVLLYASFINLLGTGSKVVSPPAVCSGGTGFQVCSLGTSYVTSLILVRDVAQAQPPDRV